MLRLLIPISPAIVVLALLSISLVAFTIRVKLFGNPDLPGADRRAESAIATRFLQRWIIWILTPPERWLAAAGVSPNAISLVSLGACAMTGVMAATGHFAIATWTYVGAGMLDVLDGRVARRTGKTSPAGALLDSVLDRWGEFFVLGGLALGLRDTLGLIAVLTCIVGSQMVSYTRARGEALGTQLSAGTMQRAERIILISAGMLSMALAQTTGAFDGHFVLVAMLALVGLWSSGTSLFRLTKGMSNLQSRQAQAQEPAAAPAGPPAATKPAKQDQPPAKRVVVDPSRPA